MASGVLDQTGRIIFTPGKGLTGVGFPRKAREADLTNDISYDIRADDRDELRTIECIAPFFRPDREQARVRTTH